MDGSEDDSATRGRLLLSQLDLIFVSDPLIDELGFVHPSQLTSLHSSPDEPIKNDSPFSKLESNNSSGSTLSSSAGGEDIPARADCSRKTDHRVNELDGAGTSVKDGEGDDGLDYDTTVFWCGDHKLAISMHALAPMYKCAKAAFMSIRTDYKKLLQAEQGLGLAEHRETIGSSASTEAIAEDVQGEKFKRATKKVRLEDRLMSYSRALVLINCDYGSAWSTRKQILLSRASNEELLAEELHMSAVVLSCGPKSEETWAYRRWIINQMITGGLSRAELDSILEDESKLVEGVAGDGFCITASISRSWYSVDECEVHSLFDSGTSHVNYTENRFDKLAAKVASDGGSNSLLIPIKSAECSALMSLFCSSGADSGLTAGFLIGVSQRSVMNYRAWRHRCWLVTQMSFLQVAIELHRTKSWATSHVADNCCFHYRRSLLLQLIKSKVPERNQTSSFAKTAVEKELDMRNLRVALLDGPEIRVLWKEEIDWIKNLIQKYVGREALWIHLRFLLFSWIQHIGPILSNPHQLSRSAACNRVSCDAKEALFAIDSEQSFASCCLSACSNTLTEEGDRQREFAVTYKLWVLMMGSRRCENEKNGRGTTGQDDFNSIEQLLHDVVPHRKQLWEGLLPNLEHAYTHPLSHSK